MFIVSIKLFNSLELTIMAEDQTEINECDQRKATNDS